MTADASPEGRLVRGVLDLFAEYERAMIKARTKAALAAKRRRGERTGGIPLGFRSVNGHLEKDVVEQYAIQRVRYLSAAGYSRRQITREMAGVQIRNGAVHLTTVQRLLA